MLKERPKPPAAKKAMGIGASVLLVLGAGAYVVYTALDNASTPARPIQPEEFTALAQGYIPEPENDELKAAAVQAYKKDLLERRREGANKTLTPVEVKEKAPGGDGFPPVNFPPGSNPDPGSNKAIAKEMLASFGFGPEQWGCLERLWQKESGWNERAANRYSGAYGIPQSLPGSKMASAGSDWQTNPATQIKWGLGYIKGRYGTPCAAWGHSQAKGWY
ncbi:lytic transglycosylase domain-containing protein [Thermoactinospora rubra]|uniref:aggregation-promoting factor C-terminal-like domain-containing protein n=1 Tax=Thermoactinospora rubra TaxID=1088767 RepID=UPI001F0A2E0C|nr:lytic transglycosylase domain-containing protein [Thermoactinospora rubra]